jgi:maleate isomerase
MGEPMTDRVLLGMLTPSSNTVLEPVTAAILAGLPEVSAHFSRFEVTRIALSDEALKQFDLEPILAAARLLAHAKVDVIAWNGTSASWLGFETDELLCQRITAETGIPATTSILALNEAFRMTGVERFALVTPYIDEVQDAIVANYRDAGLTCVAERHLALRDNFSFSEVSPETIRGVLDEVAREGPQAVTTLCTNLDGAALAEAFERETGIPLYDSISVVVWKSLVLAGVDPGRVTGWGRLFALR